VSLAPGTRPFLVAGQTAEIFAEDRVHIGVAGLVSTPLVEARGAARQDKIFVAELNLDLLASLAAGGAAAEQVHALPRFPFVVRDISMVVADTLPAEIIRGTIHAFGARGQAPLVDVAFFDRYTGKELGAGTVSLSVRLTFQSPTRTLTDAEVQHSVDTIVAGLTKEHGARQR
jgi:phenylalanyl-tRNA synthetase beta chain